MVCYLSAQVGAVVQSVTDEGRRVIVLTEDGETIEFILRLSTAAFHSAHDRSRLTLLP